MELAKRVSATRSRISLPVAAGTVPDGWTVPGSPLKVVRGPEQTLVLTWGPSCNSSDLDYEIYEGPLPQFQAHKPIVCSTDGNTTKTINPDKGNRYSAACLVQKTARCK